MLIIIFRMIELNNSPTCWTSYNIRHVRTSPLPPSASSCIGSYDLCNSLWERQNRYFFFRLSWGGSRSSELKPLAQGLLPVKRNSSQVFFWQITCTFFLKPYLGNHSSSYRLSNHTWQQPQVWGPAVRYCIQSETA